MNANKVYYTVTRGQSKLYSLTKKQNEMFLKKFPPVSPKYLGGGVYDETNHSESLDWLESNAKFISLVVCLAE